MFVKKLNLEKLTEMMLHTSVNIFKNYKIHINLHIFEVDNIVNSLYCLQYDHCLHYLQTLSSKINNN